MYRCELFMEGVLFLLLHPRLVHSFTFWEQLPPSSGIQYEFRKVPMCDPASMISASGAEGAPFCPDLKAVATV